jgi:two-component system CAI-1 autoinducer sensor kinase/phosphatase CqsS
MLPKRPTSGAESESTCNITCKSLNNIHEVIDLGSKNIRRGNKIIDSILSSLDGGEIDRAHFRYHSSEKSILAAIERD